jgi:hypothetical protein
VTLAARPASLSKRPSPHIYYTWCARLSVSVGVYFSGTPTRVKTAQRSGGGTGPGPDAWVLGSARSPSSPDRIWEVVLLNDLGGDNSATQIVRRFHGLHETISPPSRLTRCVLECSHLPVSITLWL